MKTHYRSHTFLALVTSTVFFVGCASDRSANLFAQKNGVEIVQGETLKVNINGEPFTEYHFQDVPRPFLYPVIGPGNSPMTRNWPMKDVPGEEHDHPHHRSLWFTHGDINGHDFWSESAGAGKIIHEKFIEVRSGRNEGVIKSSNKLVSKEGKTIGTDTRTLRIHNLATNRLIDFEITFHASHGDLILGDTKEGSMAVRVAESMRLKRGKEGEGHIVMSTGVRDGATWGKRAEWCDYYGPVGDKIVGIAIFDHPKNPRHPTWWHVRDYGLFAANPFGIHDFEKKEKGVGNLTIPSGENITFRYRIYFHEGDEKDGQVAQRYKNYKNAEITK